jgi:hypothetical protein
MKAVMNNLLEGTPWAIFNGKIRVYANGNKVRQAQAVDPYPAGAAHLAIMAESIDTPENTNVKVVGLVINDIIESMMPCHALRRVKRYLSRECTKPQEWSVRCYYGRLST